MSKVAIRSSGMTPSSIREVMSYLLTDPVVDGQSLPIYVGRGSFGVVRLQFYHGIKVAVKEMLPRTLLTDVQEEAAILTRLCHPYLPYLFGCCTSNKPYRLVMQFHGLEGNNSVTLQKLLTRGEKKELSSWMILFCQLLEAVKYLHDVADVLHNDIKCDNIIVTNCTPSEEDQIILIDFGKASLISKATRLELNEVEQTRYWKDFPHYSPEVITGESTRTQKSDMYAVGLVLYHILDSGCMDSVQTKQFQKYNQLAADCRKPQYLSRPKAKQCLSTMQLILQED